MILVCNTGPLIALAKIDRLSLLQNLGLAGRKVARNLELSVLGTAGLLLLAKRQGFVENVSVLIEEMRRQGYWLSDALVAQVRRLAGE